MNLKFAALVAFAILFKIALDAFRIFLFGTDYWPIQFLLAVLASTLVVLWACAKPEERSRHGGYILIALFTETIVPAINLFGMMYLLADFDPDSFNIFDYGPGFFHLLLIASPYAVIIAIPEPDDTPTEE